MDNKLEIKEKYLPLGTIVRLKDATKRLMITGFCAVEADSKGKIYDYSGCMYPQGFLSSKQTALFDHDQIEELYFMGYADEEEKEFKEKLKEALKQYESENKTNSIPDATAATK